MSKRHLNLSSIKLELVYDETTEEISIKHILNETKVYKELRDEYGQATRLEKYNDDIVELTEAFAADIQKSCLQLYKTILEYK